MVKKIEGFEKYWPYLVGAAGAVGLGYLLFKGKKIKGVVQYFGPEDRQAAEYIGRHLHLPVINTGRWEDLQDYDVVVMVGGPVVNPLYRFAMQAGVFPRPTSSNKVIVARGYWQGKTVYGVAGYETEDTLRAAGQLVAIGIKK